MSNTQADNPSSTISIVNKKARFNYEIIDTYETGLILVGSEVKSLRQGRASINEAYVRIIKGEPWLVGSHFSPYEQAGKENHDPDRNRKLLMHRREIKAVLGKVSERGFTLVPLRLYFNSRGLATLKIGLAKGKSTHDKRDRIRDRDVTRDLQRQLKRYR